MRRTPTLEDVQRLTRAQVCAQCPYRTRGEDFCGADFARRCESYCGLFIHLPVLRDTVRQLDPMLVNRRRVLSEIVRRVSSRCGRRGRVMRRNGMRVAELLEEQFA